MPESPSPDQENQQPPKGTLSMGQLPCWNPVHQPEEADSLRKQQGHSPRIQAKAALKWSLTVNFDSER